jgi:sugar phosphate isomerase/epimerase
MSNLGFHCHNLDLFDEMILGNGLSRGEFYNLRATELPRLKRLIEKHKLAWSIHAPLVQLDWYPQPPTWSFLCDPNKDKRELTMKMIILSMEHAEELGAEYLVVHFPSPISEEHNENKAKLESIARKSCDHLAELSLKRKVSIHIEGVGASPLIDADFILSVLKNYSPHLSYCFDTAHTHLAAIDNGFDLYEFEAALLPYLGSVHLWNTRGKHDYVAYRHIPVHPSQSTAEGWVDIARVLKLMVSAKSSLPIIFESDRFYPEELGDYDYREGVKWVRALVATLS